MTVLSNSRYSFGSISYVSLERDGDVYPIVRFNSNSIANNKHTMYTCTKGDRFDSLAERLYGDPTLWWRIASLNPHVNHLAVLRPGQRIKLPA